MTKLEQKLEELGYKKDKLIHFSYYKRYKYCTAIIINNGGLTGVLDFRYKLSSISTQQELDNLQQAFNEMQKDLEELKKYE